GPGAPQADLPEDLVLRPLRQSGILLGDGKGAEILKLRQFLLFNIVNNWILMEHSDTSGDVAISVVLLSPATGRQLLATAAVALATADATTESSSANSTMEIENHQEEIGYQGVSVEQLDNKLRELSGLTDADLAFRIGPTDSLFLPSPWHFRLTEFYQVSSQKALRPEVFVAAKSNQTEDMSTTGAREGLVLGMGNPLLDLANTIDAAYLAKYNLKPNDAILAGPEHAQIFDDLIGRPDTQYIPGGATQNAIRVAQWLLRTPKATSMFGCVRLDDDIGKRLRDCMETAGVRPAYQCLPNSEPTGRCAVLISGEDRSLVTQLGSAGQFTEAHLDDPTNWAIVEAAQFYYVAGFFLTVCPPALMRIAEHSLAAGKTLMMNLSAPFICQFFKEPLLAAMAYVDVLFGNETEAETYAKEAGLPNPSDARSVAVALAAMPLKPRPSGGDSAPRSRLVLITQGKGPVVAARSDGSVTEFPVRQLAPHELVDTNGAGDAFAGGFIAQFALGKPLELHNAQRSGQGYWLLMRLVYCLTDDLFAWALAYSKSSSSASSSPRAAARPRCLAYGNSRSARTALMIGWRGAGSSTKQSLRRARRRRWQIVLPTVSQFEFGRRRRVQRTRMRISPGQHEAAVASQEFSVGQPHRVQPPGRSGGGQQAARFQLLGNIFIRPAGASFHHHIESNQGRSQTTNPQRPTHSRIVQARTNTEPRPDSIRAPARQASNWPASLRPKPEHAAASASANDSDRNSAGEFSSSLSLIESRAPELVVIGSLANSRMPANSLATSLLAVAADRNLFNSGATLAAEQRVEWSVAPMLELLLLTGIGTGPEGAAAFQQEYADLTAKEAAVAD
uniref:adenosine kinase n=1 Tax=Macrostomum lignano TaxID=282301 RepID=A0A1I8IAV0_9PLAT